MPANDGTTRVWFLIIDNEKGNGISFKHQSFEYEFSEAADNMKREKLPIPYALTLSTGLWDNCEILPQFETEMQGKRLSFQIGRMIID